MKIFLVFIKLFHVMARVKMQARNQNIIIPRRNLAWKGGRKSAPSSGGIKYPFYYYKIEYFSCCFLSTVQKELLKSASSKETNQSLLSKTISCLSQSIPLLNQKRFENKIKAFSKNNFLNKNIKNFLNSIMDLLNSIAVLEEKMKVDRDNNNYEFFELDFDKILLLKQKLKIKKRKCKTIKILKNLKNSYKFEVLWLKQIILEKMWWNCLEDDLKISFLEKLEKQNQ